MSKYYLMNGTPNGAQILSLPTEDDVVREFDDISEIDLITTKIPASEAKGKLKIYNKEILRGSMLILEYPVKKTKGLIYRPFFDESSNEKASRWLHSFTPYIEERIDRVEHKELDKRVSLELTKDDKFYEYLSYILYDLNKSEVDFGANSLMGFNSLIPKDFKAQYEEYIKEQYHSQYSLQHLTRSLSNYKSLRNFMMEYIAHLSRSYGGLKRDVDRFTEEYVNGRAYCNQQMVDLASRDMAYHQMTIDECVKTLEKRK